MIDTIASQADPNHNLITMDSYPSVISSQNSLDVLDVRDLMNNEITIGNTGRFTGVNPGQKIPVV